MSAVLKRISKLFGSMPKKASGLLESRFVLYVVFMLSLINVYVLLLHNRLNALSVFFLTGIIVSAFCKNMIVILLSSIVVTNLVKEIAPSFSEGFEGDDEGKKKKGGDEEEDDGLDNDQSDSSKMSLSEDISKVIENLENGVDESKGGSKKDLNEIKGQYSELLDIQKSLLEGIRKVAEPLENAEKIITKLTDKMEGMRGSRK